VSELAGTQGWYLVCVGVFASIIQIVQALAYGFGRDRPQP
jgi:hypothetical protein